MPALLAASDEVVLSWCSNNSINDDGAVYLCQSIKFLSGLLFLDLS